MHRPRISLPPRTVIGYLPSGRPVYNLAGGSGEGDTGGTGGAAGGTGTGDQGDGQAAGAGQAPAAQPPAKPVDPPKPAAPAVDPNAPTVADLQAKLDAAEKAQASQLDAIAKALGLKGDDQAAATPEQLAARVTDLESTNRSLQTELAILKRSAALGANGAKLTDSRAFTDKLAKLDPTSDKFESQVDAAITAAIAADASLKSTPAPVTRSGGDFTGGPHAGTKPKSMQDAVAARLGR